MTKEQIKSDENAIVYVKMWGEDGNEYECVGILMKDESQYIRIAFNAHNDVAKDDLVIQKKDIIHIRILTPKEIKVVS